MRSSVTPVDRIRPKQILRNGECSTAWWTLRRERRNLGGLYSEVAALAQEKQAAEEKLATLPVAGRKLADPESIRARAAIEFARLDEVLAGGTIEQKRDLIGTYVRKIKADPSAKAVEISLYPALFGRIIAGARSDPACAVIGDMFRRCTQAA